MVEFRSEVVKGRRRIGQGHKTDGSSKWFNTEGKGQIEFKKFFPSGIVKVSNGEVREIGTGTELHWQLPFQESTLPVLLKGLNTHSWCSRPSLLWRVAPPPEVPERDSRMRPLPRSFRRLRQSGFPFFTQSGVTSGPNI